MTGAATPSPTRFAGHLSPAKQGRGAPSSIAGSPPLPHKVGERWPAKRVGEGAFGGDIQ